MAWLYLLVAVASLALTFNVYVPRTRSPAAALLSFGAAFVWGELALHQVALQAGIALAFGWLGAFESWPGQLGLALNALGCTALVGWYVASHRAAHEVERGLSDALGPEYRERIGASRSCIDWGELLRGLSKPSGDVEVLRHIEFARPQGIPLTLDLYRPAVRAGGCPVLLQIHGGGWVTGGKQQSKPMMHRLAARGWLCVSAEYRLSPRATWPDHLIDVKRALAWVREHIARYGGDPSFVVVTGGSAGGHLAALVALTQNEPRYQPGFEDADTSVQGCIALYGVLDLVDRHGLKHNRGLKGLLERAVFKFRQRDDPALYDEASPVVQAGPHAPPFFVIQGDQDTLVAEAEARHFVDVLRQRARAPVAYCVLRGAHHAFDQVPSLRTQHVIAGIERFCAWLHSRHRRLDEPLPVAVRAGESLEDSLPVTN